jgi:hypothetical protein
VYRSICISGALKGKRGKVVVCTLCMMLQCMYIEAGGSCAFAVLVSVVLQQVAACMREAIEFIFHELRVFHFSMYTRLCIMASRS